MRLAVLLSLGSSQEHDGGSLCIQGRPWKWGRSSLQPISAVLEIYCPTKSETWPHVTGPKSAFSSANPRSRVSQPLAAVAKITQSRSPETLPGQLAQHRHDPFRIMRVGRRDIDCQRDTVLFDRDLDLDAADLLAAVDAAREAARCRAAGAAVDHHSARVRRVAASQSPRSAQPVEQPAP